MRLIVPGGMEAHPKGRQYLGLSQGEKSSPRGHWGPAEPLRALLLADLNMRPGERAGVSIGGRSRDAGGKS